MNQRPVLGQDSGDDSRALVPEVVAGQVQRHEAVAQRQREYDALGALGAHSGVGHTEPARAAVGVEPVDEALLALGRHRDLLVAAFAGQDGRKDDAGQAHLLAQVQGPGESASELVIHPTISLSPSLYIYIYICIYTYTYTHVYVILYVFIICIYI